MTEKKSNLTKEVENLASQFDEFDKQVKELTLDQMNKAPKKEVAPQTELSQKELDNSQDIYLKPSRSIGGRDKFNEKFREDYEFQKEYVNFMAENKEIPGETIEMWTRPFGGMPAEFWEIPVNKPIWGPRYVAEQLKRKHYHRLKMQEYTTPSNFVGSVGNGIMQYGNMVVDTTIARLDAQPVVRNRSVFMGAGK